MSATLAELLHDQGTGLEEPDLVAALSTLLAGRIAPTGSRRPAVLTEGAQSVLRQASGIDAPTDDAADGDIYPLEKRAIADATAAVAALVTTSRSVADLAAALQVDASRIRHRAADGALYAIKVGRSNRFPAWQLDATDRPIGGLRDVLRALPDDLHPLDVEAFMTTPQPELRAGRRDRSPREWLLGGGAADAVVALAESLAISV